MEPLGASWDHLGSILGPSWSILEYLEASWAHLGSILGTLGAILGASWGLLGPRWDRKLVENWSKIEKKSTHSQVIVIPLLTVYWGGGRTVIHSGNSGSNTGNVPGGKTATHFWARVIWQPAVYREQSSNKLSGNSGSNASHVPRGKTATHSHRIVAAMQTVCQGAKQQHTFSNSNLAGSSGLGGARQQHTLRGL
jgi:hypothetical protein